MEYNTPYNPFNSMKGLMWVDHYRQINRWWNGHPHLPPPIEVSFDISHICNLKCPHCNSQAFTNKKYGMMEIEDIKALLDVYAGVGIRGVCFGGGGEPTVNPAFSAAVEHAISVGLDVGIATNAYNWSNDTIEALTRCKWVAISIDSATRGTYLKTHGKDGYGRVLNNATRLIQRSKKARYPQEQPFVSYRFLVTPENYFELGMGIENAKAFGFSAFHARAADLYREDVPMSWDSKTREKAWLEMVAWPFEHENDENFIVAVPTHKFDDTLKIRRTFKHCKASCLVIQTCSDMRTYVCSDRKMECGFELGNAYNFSKFWGSDKHRDFLHKIDVNKCTRCTWTPYMEQIDALENDPMHKNFP